MDGAPEPRPGASAPGPLPDVTLEGIRTAARRIAPYVLRTPILPAADLGEPPGCELHLKAEHLQRGGSFKVRGAHAAVLALPEAEVARGVATHSSGNHGAAVALAARSRAVPAFVVMPENAARTKLEAVATAGAEIVLCEPPLAAREATLEAVLRRTGARLVHPYADLDVIRGQGTAVLEVLEQMEGQPPDAIVVPVGGGGLLAGAAVAAKSLLPACRVFGADPAGADDAARSFHRGRLLPQESPRTLADGLLTSLGEPNFAIIRALADDVLTVSEEGIREAMRRLLLRAKQLVEPSAAVTLAALLEHPELFRGRRTVLVLSGGNLDLDRFPFAEAAAG